MRRLSSRLALASAASLALAASTAQIVQAASVGVNFRRGSGQELMAAVDSAGFIPQTNWNNTDGLAAGTSANLFGPIAGNLVDDSGAVVDGMVLDWTAQGTWSAPNGTTTGDHKLFGGYLDNTNASAPAFVDVDNIPYAHYDVYAYLGSDGNGRTGVISIPGHSTVPFSTNSNPFPGYVTAVGGPSTYVKFDGLSSPSFRLAAVRSSNNVGLHGFQIVERVDAPTPPSHTTPNLLAHFPFDEGFDSQVNSIAGVTQGNVGIAEGKFGNAITLDGVRSYVEVAPAPDSIKPLQNLTVSVWARREESGAGEIVSLGDHYGLRINANGTIHFFFDSNPTANGWTGLTTNAADPDEVLANDSQWHHIVAQKTPTHLELWLDGKRADGQSAILPTILPIDYAQLGNNFFVGAHGNGSTANDFQGAIDELRLFDGPLSASEIQSLFAANVVPEPSALVLLAGAALLPLRRRR